MLSKVNEQLHSPPIGGCSFLSDSSFLCLPRTVLVQGLLHPSRLKRDGFRKRRNKIKLGIIFIFAGLVLTISSFFFNSFFGFLFQPKLSFSDHKKLILKEIKPQDKYPVKITINEVGINLPILAQKIIDKQWPVASDSANYLIGSGIVGERGNIVIYGHALNYLFGPILNLKKGEEIILGNKKKKTFRYQVEESKIVWPNETSVIEETKDETLTLYTCYGFFDSQRYIVIAKPILLNREKAVVKRVIDGDTIELIDGRRVRYIGINTPESVDPRREVECFGQEAKEKNKELVEGKEVEIEKDVSEVDIYGRLLRYVFVNDILVNEWLVENGFAQIMTVPPDVKYQELFLEKEKEARKENRGLWGNCKI